MLQRPRRGIPQLGAHTGRCWDENRATHAQRYLDRKRGRNRGQTPVAGRTIYLTPSNPRNFPGEAAERVGRLPTGSEPAGADVSGPGPEATL
jgi:hypothetical protein